MKFPLALIGFVLFCSYSHGQNGLNYNGQFVNVKDSAGFKQGDWIVLGNMQSNPDFKPDQLVEKGQYINNRKEGIWVQYFPNGKVSSEITWQNGRGQGPYTKYYENGQVFERGNWMRNKNIGDFERFHPNGAMMQKFHFNENGKRVGVQEYGSEQGHVIIRGYWNEDGKKEGLLTRWTDDGILKSEEYYMAGTMDTTKSVFYDVPEATYVMQVDASIAPPDTTNREIIKATANRKHLFDPDGYNDLHLKDGRPAQRGKFVNGSLYDGKWWDYSKDGILMRILIYKNGKIVGTEQIEDDV